MIKISLIKLEHTNYIEYFNCKNRCYSYHLYGVRCFYNDYNDWYYLSKSYPWWIRK